MRAWEKFIVLWAVGYMVIYVPFFLFVAPQMPPDQSWQIILPLHCVGMVQNVLALGLTIRDLYKRAFPTPNQKLTWCLLITWTGGIGWLVYLFKYALKPRTSQADNGSPI